MVEGMSSAQVVVEEPFHWGMLMAVRERGVGCRMAQKHGGSPNAIVTAPEGVPGDEFAEQLREVGFKVLEVLEGE